jgi:hypothetical protein
MYVCVNVRYPTQLLRDFYMIHLARKTAFSYHVCGRKEPGKHVIANGVSTRPTMTPFNSYEVFSSVLCMEYLAPLPVLFGTSTEVVYVWHGWEVFGGM